MFDFISIEILTEPEKILFNPALNFGSQVNTDTGEPVPQREGYINREAKYEGLLFEYSKNITSNIESLKLSGSIHKYYHSGKNFADFDRFQLETAINNICSLLNIDCQQMIIHRLEFGVNISTIHPVNKILNSIICYRSRPCELREFNGIGYLNKFVLSQYEVKVYNKSKQYGLINDLLRFEEKVNKMDYLLKKGIQIRTINDLLKPDIHLQLRELLTQTFEKLLFFDYRINLKSIDNQKEREILINGSNTMFWRKYRDEHSAKGYQKKVKRFRELVLKYSPSNLQKEIEKQILDKWDLLSSYPNLPNVLTPDSYPILPLAENGTVTQYYTHIVGNNDNPVKRYCLTCGREITHQKKGSLFCSEKLYGPQVKKCRNKVSNRKQFELKYYSSPLLFVSCNLFNSSM